MDIKARIKPDKVFTDKANVRHFIHCESYQYNLFPCVLLYLVQIYPPIKQVFTMWNISRTNADNDKPSEFFPSQYMSGHVPEEKNHLLLILCS